MRRWMALGVCVGLLVALAGCGGRHDVMAESPSGCVVNDPRPGDLRDDPGADLLPADYQAPPPASTVAHLAYGGLPEQVLDLHLPATTRPRPVLVWVHPGGWVAGSRLNVPEMVRRQVARAGFAVASVDYRLSSYTADGQPVHPFPAAVSDVKAAIRWLKANAATHNLRADRIILVGGSAGGHLAAFAGVTPGRFEPPGQPLPLSSEVAGVVSISGPMDLATLVRGHPWGTGLTEAFLGCPQGTPEHPVTCTDEQLRAASVATYLDPSDPPAYLAYGEEDGLVDPRTQGAAARAAWVSVKPDDCAVAYDFVEGSGHNLDHDSLNLRAFELFLDEVVAGTVR